MIKGYYYDVKKLDTLCEKAEKLSLKEIDDLISKLNELEKVSIRKDSIISEINTLSHKVETFR